MRRSAHRLRMYSAALVLAASSALGLAPAAFGDDWARDRAAVVGAIEDLDPAIRTAVVARTSESPATPPVVASAPAVDDGFAWGAAAIGLGVGVAAMCVVLGSVTLVRSHGRLRSV